MLLDAKLAVPAVRAGSVSRTDLITRARASNCRVVGITAPAGYGKSTLLAQWAEAEDRRVAWVSLDRFDDDPAALLSVVASAYAAISPDLADLIADVRGLGISSLGRAAPRLAAALHASPEPFVLMLDDPHALRSPACHDVLSVVISGVPQGSQLVAASRSAQPHLAHLRGTGDTVEVTSSDLAFDASAAVRVFTQAQVELTPEMAAAVTERTEGWPVGLYLAALISKDQGGGAPTSPVTTATLPTTCTASHSLNCQTVSNSSYAGPRYSIRCVPRCAMRSSNRRVLRRSCASWRPRACSWFRSTAAAAGFVITLCSESSCCRSSTGSSRISSRVSAYEPPTGTKRTARRRWRWSTCWTRPSGIGASIL